MTRAAIPARAALDAGIAAAVSASVHPGCAEPRDHPAAIAWAMLRPESRAPRAVERLQEKAKGSVYRLHGVGPCTGSVIAKCSSVPRIRRERAFYADVLPQLDVSVVRCHGVALDAEAGCAWLFLEDAAGVPYAPADAAHRALAGEWLGRLHVAGAGLPARAELPDRGPAFHRAQLHAARRLLERFRANPALGADDVRVIDATVRQCHTIADHWSEVEAVCDALPCTIVHGDFAPKNMRVRTAADTPVLLPFDWGSAGLAVAAADLVQWSGRTASPWGYWANPDLEAYRRAVQGTWPRLDRSLLERAATIGKLFRCMVCVALSAQSFATPWVEHAAQNMRVYQAEIADALEAAGWATGGEP